MLLRCGTGGIVPDTETETRESAVKYTIMKGGDQDTRVKLGGAMVRCYSAKKLHALYPDHDYTVVGEVKQGSDKKKVGELNTGHVISQRGSHNATLNRVVGYLRVGEDMYVAVLQPRPVIPIAAVVAMVLVAVLLVPKLLGGSGGLARPDAFGDAQVGGKQEMADISQDDTSQQEKLEDRIRFAGYGTAYVSAERQSIELSNPSVNTVDFVFTVKDKATGEVLAVTDSVAPGQYAYVNVYEHFKGTTGGVLSINTATFTSDDVPQSGFDSEIKIEVK